MNIGIKNVSLQEKCWLYPKIRLRSVLTEEAVSCEFKLGDKVFALSAVIGSTKCFFRSVQHYKGLIRNVHCKKYIGAAMFGPLELFRVISKSGQLDADDVKVVVGHCSLFGFESWSQNNLPFGG